MKNLLVVFLLFASTHVFGQKVIIDNVKTEYAPLVQKLLSAVA